MRNSLVVEFRVLLELSNNTLTDLITNSLDYPVELSFFHKMALVLLLCSPSRARDQTSCRTQSSSSSRRPPPPPRSWRPTPLPPGNTTTACSPATRPPAALALAVFDCGATPLACATDVVGALSCEAAVPEAPAADLTRALLGSSNRTATGVPKAASFSMVPGSGAGSMLRY